MNFDVWAITWKICEVMIAIWFVVGFGKFLFRDVIDDFQKAKKSSRKKRTEKIV